MWGFRNITSKGNRWEKRNKRNIWKIKDEWDSIIKSKHGENWQVYFKYLRTLVDSEFLRWRFIN